MSRSRRPNRAWRRRSSNPGTDPETVLRELQRREFRTLEDCRLVWEEAGDPIALCVAVSKVDLPEWLADALLAVVTEDATGKPPFLRLRDRWKKHALAAVDAARASASLTARGHLAQTWEQSWSTAESAIQAVIKHAPKVGQDAIKASHRRVRSGLDSSGMYYQVPPDLRRRVLLALFRTRQMIARQRGRK